MENQKDTKTEIPEVKQLQLVRKSELFKIIIPKNVEEKIRHLCNKVSNTEWSGVLFYDFTGNWEDKDLTITCKDIHVMDIGTSTYTEFDVDPSVISYSIDNDLLDYQIGLIHSHSTFKTFFSGTDLNTLRDEGSRRNHFVSLIVNNEGKYTAAITRQVKAFRDIEESCSYNTFGGDIVKTTKKKYTVVEDEIEYAYLEIIKEDAHNNYTELDSRLEEIKEKKTKEKKDVPVKCTWNTSAASFTDDWKDYYKPKFKQPSLFDDKEPILDFSQKEIDNIVMQILTGSIAATVTDKVTPEIWANKMVNIFNKRFEDMDDYEVWIGYIIEFIINNDKKLSTDQAYLASLIAERIEQLPKNDYIKIILEELNLWM